MRAVQIWLVILSAGCATNQLRIRPTTVAPDVEIRQTVILVGDAGAAAADDPVMAAVSAVAAERPERTVVVYLGDNVYPRGLAPDTSSSRPQGESRLLAQLAPTFATGVSALFVPGNHDWDHSGPDGLRAIRRMDRFLRGIGQGERVALLPGDGCPGPEVRDLERIRLVAIDTQWWLHPHERSDDTVRCTPADEPGVLAAFREALEGADGRIVIVLGHHPLASSGMHGGRFRWEDHVFPLRRVAGWLWVPLPIVGSLYPLMRILTPGDQDLSSGPYRTMREALEGVMADARPLIYAAGHEHNLQVMTGRAADYYLVSGAGPSTGVQPTGWLDRTLYAHGRLGFMRLDIFDGGRVRLGVIEVADGGGKEVFSRWLDPGR